MGETNHGRGQLLERLIDEVSAICENPLLERLRPMIVEVKIRLTKDEVHLAFLGQMKRGKSSLLNALLGESLLPTGMLPLTSVITEIRYGEKPAANVLYRSGHIWEITPDQMAEYATEAGNPGNRKEVALLRIFYPCDLLQDGLVLIDTPGIGSTYFHNTHTTEGYLSQFDAGIVVFSADPPITEIEAQFVRSLRDQIPQLVFVLNKSDLATEEELGRICGFLHDELANRVGLRSCEIFPLSTRDQSDPGLTRFVEFVRQFGRYGHEQALFLSLLKDIEAILTLASFALSLGSHVTSLSPSELENKKRAIGTIVAESDAAVAAMWVLLRQDQTDVIEMTGKDLDEHVKAMLPALQARFSELQRSHSRTSGRELGALLEGFFDREIANVFRDWRMQEDVRIAAVLEQLGRHYAEKATSILNTLVKGLGSLIGVYPEELKISGEFAMDAKVSYSTESVFYSLDRFLLAIPPPLQRAIVFRRVRKSIPGRLDQNAGRIRFDYRERVERSFQHLERILRSQLQTARHTILAALDAPASTRSVLEQVNLTQDYVRRLLR